MSDEPVTTIQTPIRLEYAYTPGAAKSRFLRAIARKKILGQRCPQCGKVYVPPLDFCPRDGIPVEGDLELPDTGVVTTFCIVNVPFAGQAVECPYVSASILVDGADIPIFHLVQEVPAEDVRMGMRVRAVWRDEAEMEPSFETIRYFAPTGEPDVPVSELLARLRADA